MQRCRVPFLAEECEKGSSFRSQEKDKGSAFIVRERFPYFLLVALVRPAIDKANPLSPLLATLTLVHPLCTLFRASTKTLWASKRAFLLRPRPAFYVRRGRLHNSMVQFVERSSLLGVEEFARLILSNEPLLIPSYSWNGMGSRETNRNYSNISIIQQRNRCVRTRIAIM